MEKKAKTPRNITDHMVLIGFGLAIFYWLCESFLNLFSSHQVSFLELLMGKTIDQIWPRLIVLCLFFIFGSHAQFTIDNRKKAEKALSDSEERYRTLVENLPIGICRHMPGETGHFIMANPAFLQMFEIDSREDVADIAINDIFLKSRDCREYLEHLKKHKSLSWSEIQLLRKNGKPIWCSVSARIVYDDRAESVSYIDCTFEDIDARKKAAREAAQAEETRRRFQKLMSPDLAEMVVSGALKVEKGGESRNATVLFADIRGFTSLSENTEATEVLQMLNEYFESMVEIVFRYEGTVDKFIGDAIMVIWGAPVFHEDDPMRAVNAAIEMQSVLAVFNRKRHFGGKQPIRIGIGINTGRLVAGYIGSSQTMSYSVIGDTVNTAARLCAIAKAGQIIISENTHRAVEKAFVVTKLNDIRLKGKLKPINIYNVLDHSRMPTSLVPSRMREA